jgi:ribosome biogenesis GTPase
MNKLDLKNTDVLQETFQPYLDLAYPVLFTCTKDGYGVDKLHRALIGNISLFTGPSGVGKSSLLNAIQPGLGLAVKEISHSTSKGKHTTVVRELFALEAGGWVADTPGLKALALWDIEPEELDGYFPEFRSRVAACQFNNCSHQHEPGCAILQAVQDGSIHPQRYESYLRMRFGE